MPEPKSQYGTNLRITVAANQGGRRYMEDRFLVHTERAADKTLKWVFMGVFDGHGGEHASEYVRRNLLENITGNKKFDSEKDSDILEAIREGFLMTHEMMRDVHEEWPYTASGYPSTAGTTVSCVFIRNGKLYTGHVGDSAIFMGVIRNNRICAIPLTVDHKPESMVEQMRIEDAGGSTAVKSGVTRVVWRRPVKGHQNRPALRNRPTESIPFLSVARSLGDLWSFCEETNMFVVSPEPDVDVHHLKDDAFCLILASDGLTNVMTPEQAVSIVFEEEELVELDSDKNQNHARCLLRSTLQRWRNLRADNVTVATAIFDTDITSYQDSEVLMKLGSFTSVDQVLTDKPDAMLHVSNKENVVLCTRRTPIIYSGAKDVNFCRVNYRGPGFRTHEEEIEEEERNIMLVNDILGANYKHDDEEGIHYDDDDDDEDEHERATELTIPLADSRSIKLTVANEVKMTTTSISGRVVETRIVMVPSPRRPTAPLPEPCSPDANSSTFEPDEGTDEEDERMEETVNSSATKKNVKNTPSKGPSTSSASVRRVKAEACRRLRSPKPAVSPEIVQPTDERRLTRSASRASAQKTVSAKKRRSHEGLATPSSKVPKTVTPKRSSSAKKAAPLVTPRRSLRKVVEELNSAAAAAASGSANNVPLTTPKSLTPSRLPQSRKRGRAEMMQDDEVKIRKSTGVTPAVGVLSISDNGNESGTPKKAGEGVSALKKHGRWSLSKLDSPKPEDIPSSSSSQPVFMEDGIVRVYERADEDESVDALVEPPSKMRKLYGFMKRFIGWSGASNNGNSK